MGPAGKIEVIPKNLVREKVFWGAGEILERGYKRAVDGQKIERLQKKSSGRRPSYATA